MTNDEKFNLIARNLEEVLTKEELKTLIDSGQPLRHYIGFEISGKLHIGYLFTVLKIKDLQDAGAETIIWLADLHSAINDKLDGNIETIKRVARGYFTQAFKVLFRSIGGDDGKLQFKLCSETYAQNPDFWVTFLETGKSTTLARTKRSITIMGREESEEIDTAKIMYPIMQAADIFLLGVNIAHAGIDQRKVHVIAREAASALGQRKPVAVHHPILLGLDVKEKVEGEADEVAMKTKMSKSKPESAIYIHDDPEVIKRKINASFAPEGIVEFNPILDWTKHLIFYDSLQGQALQIQRDQKWGGDVTYESYSNLEKDYGEKKLHPQDLKNALADWLIQKLEPVRTYFRQSDKQALLDEISRLSAS